MRVAKNSLNSKPLKAIKPKVQTKLIIVSVKNTHKQALFTVGIQDCKPFLRRYKDESLFSIAKSGVERKEKKSRIFKIFSTLVEFILFFITTQRERF